MLGLVLKVRSRARRAIVTSLSIVRRPRSHHKVRVYLYGGHSDDWTRALSLFGPVWALMPRVFFTDMVLERDRQRLLRAPPFAGRTVVLPLLERHVRTLPRLHEALVPSIEAIDTLSDKLAFDAYARDHGLALMVPRQFELGRPEFPAVLKRADLNGGNGIELVRNENELNEQLSRDPWQGQRVMLSEFIPGSTDYVTHMVLKNGRPIWSTSYMSRLSPGQHIQRQRNVEQRGPYAPSHQLLHQLVSFLIPLGYSGPVAFDYRIDAQGQLKVLEINPRLGGSLMRPENVHDLRAALDAIIENADPLAFESRCPDQ